MNLQIPVHVEVDGAHCGHDCPFRGRLGEPTDAMSCSLFHIPLTKTGPAPNPLYFRCDVCVLAFGQGLDRTKALRFWYVNYKGEHSHREVYPQGIRFGTTEYYPEPQWLLDAYDFEKKEGRTFAMARINTHPEPRRE